LTESASKPLITTVIPTYRRPKLLGRAISSVLSQTYPHIKVCIYDNASGDETATVVREFAETDPRVEYHCHKGNIGGFRNFVYGMKEVKTPFFSCLSDDDVLLPDFLRKALEGFDRHPAAVFSSLATIHIDDTGTIWSVPLLAWHEGLYTPPQGLLAMLKYRHPDWTAILFRREVMDKVGGLDEETGAPSDLDYELRIAARWPIVISKEPGALLVSHSNARTNMEPLEALWPAWQKMIRNLSEDKRIPYDVRSYAKESMLRFFRSHYIPLGGMSFVVNKDWRHVELAATILREHYHQRFRPRLLRGLAWSARNLPPTFQVMSLLNALRKSVRPLSGRHLQTEYGHYARLLGRVS
jgi:glycosyltransferase involved in cell wall biosynthesis